jgi:hypothetical protein
VPSASEAGGGPMTSTDRSLTPPTPTFATLRSTLPTTRFARGGREKKVYCSSRCFRASANHFRNMSSVSIISVKPARLIFTVETIEGGPGWVWP